MPEFPRSWTSPSPEETETLGEALGRTARAGAVAALSLGVSAVAIGIARRALDEFMDLAGSKTPTGANRVLANRAMVQRDVAMATAELESAVALTVASEGP